MYSRPDRPNAVLIHYAGDETVAYDGPHGNAKKTLRQHVRIQPSVMADIRAVTGGTPQQVYQSMVLAAAGNSLDQPSTTGVPRNAVQVRNTMRRKRIASRQVFPGLKSMSDVKLVLFVQWTIT